MPTRLRQALLAPRVLSTLVVALTLGWVALLAMELTGVGRWRELPMGAKGFEAKENRWIWHLPRRYATHLAEVRGRLTEDGQPLFRASSHRDVRLHGAGRFRLHGRTVSFAPWDNSDPNTNGRKYRFHAPRPVNPWLLWGGLAVLLSAHAMARNRGLWARAPAAGRSPRGPWHVSRTRLAVGLFALALLARALWMLSHPDFNDGVMMVRGMPYSDAAWWLEMARSMADGDGLSGPSNGQRPLYPLLLSPLLAAGLEPVAAAQWMNVILGAGTAAVAGTLVAAIAGPWAAVAVAAFFSLGGMQIRLLPLPMSESAGLAMLLTALVFWWRGRSGRGGGDHFWGGVFFGLSNLTCPFTALGFPLAALAAASGPGGWRALLKRGSWVALGTALVIVPWLVRQKLTHGMATLSLNGPQMLYATASPSGSYDEAILAPLAEAGVSENDAARQARIYSQRFREAVLRDPATYLRRVRHGFTTWWEKFDPHHPVTVMVLIVGGLCLALSAWSRGGGPGALVAAALVPLTVLGAARLPGWLWALLAVGAAVSTRDRRCHRLAALVVSIVLGCAAMNALTSGALANRLWVMADGPLVVLAMLGLHHGVSALSRWRSGGTSIDLRYREPLFRELHGLNTTAWLQGGWTALGALVTIGLALRGPSPPPPLPTPSPSAVQTALRETLNLTGLANRISIDHAALEARPLVLTSARAHIPARHSAGHWSRAFTPRNSSRTVVMATSGEASITLQIPGDARSLPSGPWLAVGLVNRDLSAFLGAETELFEVLALWPVDANGNLIRETAPTVFRLVSAVRALLPPLPPSRPERDAP